MHPGESERLPVDLSLHTEIVFHRVVRLVTATAVVEKTISQHSMKTCQSVNKMKEKRRSHGSSIRIVYATWLFSFQPFKEKRKLSWKNPSSGNKT